MYFSKKSQNKMVRTRKASHFKTKRAVSINPPWYFRKKVSEGVTLQRKPWPGSLDQLLGDLSRRERQASNFSENSKWDIPQSSKLLNILKANKKSKYKVKKYQYLVETTSLFSAASTVQSCILWEWLLPLPSVHWDRSRPGKQGFYLSFSLSSAKYMRTKWKRSKYFRRCAIWSSCAFLLYWSSSDTHVWGATSTC